MAKKVAPKKVARTIAEGRIRFAGTLSSSDKRDIVARHKAGETIATIATDLGMSNGKVWLVLHPDYRFPAASAGTAGKKTKKGKALASLKAGAKARAKKR